ncbi:RNA polymerase sigma factor [Nocardioides agariphilus]|uniref:RNA polymerase sigma factor n=1 Tax=Nocardioides agariphilus TaxID=433664 RepID=A0A930VPN3_9ACTN|nr:RNA polymerase sigma factor [Nocardioides agariphilus]MBF4767680.1 RNA polymerase sigma factor [Nocardioides agariphilus]
MSEPSEIERIFREEYGRVVASLIRRFGDIDLAEDAASEALLAAVERWPVDGVPPNPGGWLTTTAARRGIDKLRRESHRDAKQQQAAMIVDPTPHEPTGLVEDDRLRLIFVCCHPALAPEARVALTLRLLGGLTVPEIAAAFFVSEATMGQRITRAKKKIAAAKIPYRVPSAQDLPSRLAGVLAVLYLVFNEGYLATSGPTPVRVDLTSEAIRLCRVLRSLLPTEPEVAGLLALMLLTDARRTARFADGVLVPLMDQDRAAWDGSEIAEGLSLVRECLAVNRPGVYQIQAAVNAVHSTARTGADTDWSQIAALYAQLFSISPTPVVALNRAVAVSELDGPAVGLAEVDRLHLPTYHAWHATRAELLRRLGRYDESRSAYDSALALIDNDAERAYLTRRRDEL